MTVAAMRNGLAHQEDDGRVPRARWPRIESEVLETAHAVATEVRRMRGDEPPSVLHEELLTAHVHRAVEAVIAAPMASSVPLAAAAELAQNPAYRRTVSRAAIMLASHLYPLSLLVYGGDLENITCLAHDHWIVSTVGRKLSLVGGSPFASDEEVLEFFRRIVRLRGVSGDQSITDATPIAEANIGSIIRICVAKRPAVSGQAAVKAAVRIPARTKVRHLDDYVTGLVMPPGCARFLEACVRGRANLMIAGGTSTGKTTLLRVLCGMVPAEEHLVVVEDGAELHLDQEMNESTPWHPVTTSLSTVPSIRADAESQHLSMFELVRHSLRFQPDRLILGESRGEEMAAVCKALLTGHDGSMTTIHAEDAELAVEQAVQYVMEHPRFSANERLARRVVEQAIHVVVHLANQEGRRRLTGMLAVERGGNHKWIYRQTDGGGIRRATELIGNLGRLAIRVRPHLPADEVPLP